MQGVVVGKLKSEGVAVVKVLPLIQNELYQVEFEIQAVEFKRERETGRLRSG